MRQSLLKLNAYTLLLDVVKAVLHPQDQLDPVASLARSKAATTAFLDARDAIEASGDYDSVDDLNSYLKLFTQVMINSAHIDAQTNPTKGD